MLSKSAARRFFLAGTAICSVAFILLTVDTIRQVPKQTNEQEMTAQVVQGKHIWESNNCMGCHTILGEGAYYAPELTKVYERRGPVFIRAMIKDPQAMYPGDRKMVKYNFSDDEIEALVAFFKWIGGIDRNGFPAKPNLVQVAVQAEANLSGGAIAPTLNRPQIFNQMCLACHSFGGQGGNVGPALDTVGDRRDKDNIISWLHDPQAVKPGAKMPKLPLSETDINELAAFLSLQKSGVK